MGDSEVFICQFMLWLATEVTLFSSQSREGRWWEVEVTLFFSQSSKGHFWWEVEVTLFFSQSRKGCFGREVEYRGLAGPCFLKGLILSFAFMYWNFSLSIPFLLLVSILIAVGCSLGGNNYHLGTIIYYPKAQTKSLLEQIITHPISFYTLIYDIYTI